MKLCSTSLPEGFDAVDEFIYCYNSAGINLYRGDVVVLDLEAVAKQNSSIGGINSGWSSVRVPSALSAICGIAMALSQASLNQTALGKFQVRGKDMQVRAGTGGALLALTQGWGGALGVFPGITFSAAPAGSGKCCAILLDNASFNGGTAGANDAVGLPRVCFDGVNGLRG